MRRSGVWLGFVATLALLVVACGGDDSLSDEAYFESLDDIAVDVDLRELSLFGLAFDTGVNADALTPT